MKKLFSIFALFVLCTSCNKAFILAQEIWIPTSIENAPTTRFESSAVWTGSRVIVWGGADYSVQTYYNSGGIFNPDSNVWSLSTQLTNAPVPRFLHSAIWTGSKMIIWGGSNDIIPIYYNTGGIYDPISNSWSSISLTNAPNPRSSHSAIWTGSKMIIWGGSYWSSYYYNTGGIYDPLTNTWTAISTVNAPSARYRHSGVWTGSKMIIWGGNNTVSNFNNGGIYDPSLDTWLPISTINAPSGREYHSTVWTGSKMIVWGGMTGTGIFYNTGGIYDLLTNTWTAISTVNAPSARYSHSGVWTGSRMIIWGGYNGQSYLNSGAIYNPSSDTWSQITNINTPTKRGYHIGVWSGSKMIIWGGRDESLALNTGGVYTNPSLGIKNTSFEIPSDFELHQNYPNPFNPTTKIRFAIPNFGFTTLKVFDILGKEVATLVNEKLQPGTYETTFDGNGLNSGVYFYILQTDNHVETKRITLVK